MFRFGFSNAGEVSSFALDALDHMFVQISDNVRAFRVWQDKNKGDEGSKKAGPESDEEEEEVDEMVVKKTMKATLLGDAVSILVRCLNQRTRSETNDTLISHCGTFPSTAI